jgi:diacylglycerol kinase
MTKKKSGLKSTLYSFRYAFSGLTVLIKNEPNARIHFIAAVLAIAMGLVFKLGVTEWGILLGVIGLVFITELINSSIELMADLIDPDINPQIKKIKDYGAASVLISAILAVIAGGIIFLPKLF